MSFSSNNIIESFCKKFFKSVRVSTPGVSYEMEDGSHFCSIPLEKQKSNKNKDLLNSVQKMKFSINNFFSKCKQIRSFLRVWSHLLKKSLLEYFIFMHWIFRLSFLQNICNFSLYLIHVTKFERMKSGKAKVNDYLIRQLI